MESLTVNGRKWFVVFTLVSFALLQDAGAGGNGLGLTSTSVVAICASTNVIRYQDISVSAPFEHPIWSMQTLSTNIIRAMERQRVLAALENVIVSNIFFNEKLNVPEWKIYERTTNLVNSAFGESIFTVQMASNQQAQLDTLMGLANMCVTNSDLADDVYHSQYADTMKTDTWSAMKQLCQTTNGVTQFRRLYPQVICASTVSNQFVSLARQQLIKETVINHLISTTEIINVEGYVQWLYDQMHDVQFLVPEFDPRAANSPDPPVEGIDGPEPELPLAGAGW